jgi:hypothetical protein
MSYQHQVLGTVIASVLHFDQLCQAMNENPAFKAATSTFCPCDGRSITGSQLAKGTNIKDAVDLRGRFIRGLNEIYSADAPVLDIHSADEDGTLRKVGDYQADLFKNHSHQSRTGSGFNAGGGGAPYARNDAGFNVLTETTLAGGSETRPRNIALYFYMKIN